MTKFIYNPKTCRYEREGVNLWRIAGLCILVLALGCAFFVGIAGLHAILFKSEEEVRLRNENAVLERYYSLVNQQYKQTEEQLAAIEQKDQQLKASLFNSLFDDTNNEVKHTDYFVPSSDLTTFRKQIAELSDITTKLSKDASFNSHYFSNQLSAQRQSTWKKLRTTPSIQPVQNGKLISGFGKRVNPFHKGLYQHPGIDIAATRGTEIVATADGTVSDLDHSELLAGYGNFIDITHNANITTRYAHLETILVKRGQRVKKGQVIGTVGNSGGSIAPHLHYEVLENGKEQNPIHFLLQNINAKDYQQLLAISEKQNQSLD